MAMARGPAHRAYRGTADLQAMQEAVQRAWTPQSYWHIGDLAWGRKPRPSQHRGPTALWEVDGQVVAWGCVELPGDLGVFVNPDHPELADQVLAWFDGVIAGADRSVTVMATDDHLIHALHRAGYQPAQGAPFFNHCLLELTGALPAPELPAGYRIRAVRAGEAGARAAVHRAAWRPRSIGKLLVPPVDLSGESTLTAASYQAVMETWPYQPQLDRVVQAPDGTLVAFALGWLDKDNRVGELEPVGTDPSHARQGLGAAVSLACLHAMRELGATQAVVYPRGDSGYPVPRHLYRRLGFRAVARTIPYVPR